MLFNSLAFAIFLPLVFATYWGMRRVGLRAQNAFLIVVSYLFYGWWDYRFLVLIAFSSALDYVVGWKLETVRRTGARRGLLAASLLGNLGLLGVFKYFNFFVDSFRAAMVSAGLPFGGWSINVILPVGISFYTFQTLSYTIDVYRGTLRATRDPFAFFAFVSFFPQLVAGPIERASRLLPQFLRPRTFDAAAARDGLRQMLWGFFKKLVVADNLARWVEPVFAQATSAGAVDLVAGVVFFAFQIYCDFSGYSDIAIGCARLFGVSLTRNFAYPYFARSVAEFWRRWHISLSTWFRDYVYIPLGGSLGDGWRKLRNVLVTFTVSGLWHGANWTFVTWGALNGVFFAPLLLTGRHRREPDESNVGSLMTVARNVGAMLATFGLVALGWVFFRASSISSAWNYLAGIVTLRAGSVDAIPRPEVLQGAALIAAVVLPEWRQRTRPHPLDIAHLHRRFRWLLYVIVTIVVLVFGNFGEVQFIYFQF